MALLNVDLGERSYPIYIGQNLLNNMDIISQHITGRQVMVVSNTVVAPLYLEQLVASLEQAGKVVDVTVLPDGESHKNLTTLNLIFDELLANKHGRDTCLIALGGGVIGDMAGFAASCYQRGVEFIQVPTTLLSQVDSSVGGKTAVNHPLGKNMIGAFYQPNAVFIDINCLKTLPVREFAAGMAEVIKYAIIWDKEFYQWLKDNRQQILDLSPDVLSDMIEKCCDIKAQVVAQDEHEHGVRALLNFGHTFGHAIEAEQGYGVWLHGEAVAAGSVIAAKTSVLRGDMTDEELDDIKDLFRSYSLPITKPQAMDFPEFCKHMAVDKKVLAGQLRFVLPMGIGHAKVVSDVDNKTLKNAIENH